MAKPSVKQHLTAIRQLFDYMGDRRHIAVEPGRRSARAQICSQTGQDPGPLRADQARQLLDSIDVAELSGIRDRALIGVMVFTFARVTAVTTMA